MRSLVFPLALLTILSAAAGADATNVRSQPLQPRSRSADGAPPFTRLPAAETNVNVPNVFNDPRMWSDRFRELTLGAVETGIAIADFDHDGRLDIFAVSKNGPCALYRQVAPFRFVDVAATAGVSCPEPANHTGATAVDLNQDGAMDLYVCRHDAPNLLFLNQGDGTFVECAADHGLAVHDASVHAAFADYDRDGDLDAYLVTNILDFTKSPQGRRDYLFRNDGTGRFTNVAAEAGIWGLTQGHSAIWFDANRDGWPDLYVTNDFETPDRFYLNRGDGTFIDVVEERLPHVPYFSMGVDAGDLNNDGLIDCLVSDMRDRSHREYMIGMEELGRGLWEMERVAEVVPQYMWNAIFLNSGTDRFQEIAHLAGMEATGWTFGTRLADLNNDGRLDAFFTCGMIRNFIDADIVDQQNRAPTLAARAKVWQDAPPRVETTLAFRNNGDLSFQNVSVDWGLDESTVAFGCALADLDGDGDLDVVYANYNRPPSIIRNDTRDGNALTVRLEGRTPNRQGIGAELRLESDAGVQVRQLFPERGIVASEPPVAHFGLGADVTAARLTIRWPRGQVQVLENLPAGRAYTITEPPLPADAPLAPALLHTPRNPDALLSKSTDRGLKYEASLQRFDELTRQRLLPRRLHGSGPAIATADVNGDDRADVFISGSPGRPGVLFLAQADGTFQAAANQPWAAAADAEDVGACFLDVNGDEAPDLVIAAGGVTRDEGDPVLNDRLYLNDGHGAFTTAPAGMLPADGTSTQAIAAADFDGDGRTDLFIGGRVVPGRYPATPRSFLYRYNGDTFTDITDEFAPGLRESGMVTGAAFTDVDGDGWKDLVVAREWGPVSCWRNTDGGFENVTATAGLAPITGWWSALAVADVNGDGRPDLIAGNNGLNTKYHASAEHPTILFAGVFDDGGEERLVEAQYEDGRLYPVRGRSKLATAFPWLPRRFPTYAAYAQATIEAIFSAERLAAVRKLAAAELASGVFINRSDSRGIRFEFQPLPRYAQMAPINAIVAEDVDGDGNVDLVCVGNNFGPEPSTGRFDGGLGVLLRGDGHGSFEPLRPDQSGLAVPGDARAAAAVPLDGGRALGIVVARRDGPVLVFATKPTP